MNAFGILATCASYLTPFVDFLSYTRNPHLPQTNVFSSYSSFKNRVDLFGPNFFLKKKFSLSHTIPRPPHPLVPQKIVFFIFFSRKVGLLCHITTIIRLWRKCKGKPSIARITLEHLIINTWTYMTTSLTNT